MWNLDEKKEEMTLLAHTDSVFFVAISQDLNYLVSGSRDLTIKVWNLDEKRVDFILKGHTLYVKSVTIS